jgi:hypothetical protein
MVKFRERKVKRRYKQENHDYRGFSMEFPARMNEKIEPHKNKNYDEIDITSRETATQEFLTISLGRDKTPEEIQ